MTMPAMNVVPQQQLLNCMLGTRKYCDAETVFVTTVGACRLVYPPGEVEPSASAAELLQTNAKTSVLNIFSSKFQ
jgi:hypothetical protein